VTAVIPSAPGKRATQKVAIVTGGSRGIGRAGRLAAWLAADDARVVVDYRSDRAAAEKLVVDIEDDGGQAVAVQAGVADPEQLTHRTHAHNHRRGTCHVSTPSPTLRPGRGRG